MLQCGEPVCVTSLDGLIQIAQLAREAEIRRGRRQRDLDLRRSSSISSPSMSACSSASLSGAAQSFHPPRDETASPPAIGLFHLADQNKVLVLRLSGPGRWLLLN
jgi:hypothetical protein